MDIEEWKTITFSSVQKAFTEPCLEHRLDFMDVNCSMIKSL
jgi:hypothetical protein